MKSREEYNDIDWMVTFTNIIFSSSYIFVSAAWKALKEVYPDCDIRGCVFHWGQESEFLREVGYMYAPKD